jgi:hypothetical protein
MLAVVAMLAGAAPVTASPAVTNQTGTVMVAKADKVKQVSGTIEKWDEAGKTFSIKSTMLHHTFQWTGNNLEKVGEPAVGARVNVWYTKLGKSKVASKVQVLKTADENKKKK